MSDPLTESVVERLRSRAEVGLHKYGVTLDRADLTEDELLRHLQHELMDAIMYIEALFAKRSQ